jgi:hypothetical protein
MNESIHEHLKRGWELCAYSEVELIELAEALGFEIDTLASLDTALAQFERLSPSKRIEIRKGDFVYGAPFDVEYPGINWRCDLFEAEKWRQETGQYYVGIAKTPVRAVLTALIVCMENDRDCLR